MLFDGPVGAEVDHSPPTPGEDVGDQAAVTAAPIGLGAHERRPPLRGEPLEPFEPGGELVASRVLGVGGEGRVSPLGLRRPAPGAPPAAELLAEPLVGDPGRRERVGERVGAELGAPSRARIATDVGERLDPMGGEQAQEALDRVGRVTDGEDLGSLLDPPILPRERP